jgi:hypothetical protein
VPKVKGEIVLQWVEHPVFMLQILRVGPEVSFEQVAPGTGIDQVVVAVGAARGHGAVVVNRQLATGIYF